MKKGYLVSFEGQDANGKSSLLNKVSENLRTENYPVVIVEEFSRSVMGNYLRDLLAEDKFLRFGRNLPTAFTGTMYVVADLYFQDEQEIRPSLTEGAIVLKERHIDTLFACQIPKIRDDYPHSDYQMLYRWVESLISKLYIPDVTFLLTIPRNVQISRIIERGETVSNEDLRIFEEREKIYRELAERTAGRIIVFNNDKPVEEAANEITMWIKTITK